MKKLFFAILLGAALSIGLSSCNKDKNNEEGSFFRYGPIKTAGDRIVRIDLTVYSTGAAYYLSVLASYNDAGRVKELLTVGGTNSVYEYKSNGFTINNDKLSIYPIYSGCFPDAYVYGVWSPTATETYVYDNGTVSEEYKSNDGYNSSETIVLNGDGTAKSVGDSAIEWADGNIVSITNKDGSYSELEYSEQPNPWCGADVVNALLSNAVPDVTLGHLHTKNIPSKINSYDANKKLENQYEIKAELDEKGRPVKLTLYENKNKSEEMTIFYGTHDASTVHYASGVKRLVTRQEIQEEKFVTSEANNYSFSYGYKVKTEFSDGTDAANWYYCPTEVTEVETKEPDWESTSLSKPEFLGMDPLAAGSEEVNKVLEPKEVPSTVEIRRLNFKTDTKNEYIDAKIHFSKEHGLVYFDGKDRILHHTMTNAVVRLGKDGWKAPISAQQTTVNGHSATMVSWKGYMELDINGVEGKKCFTFSVNPNLYKYN